MYYDLLSVQIDIVCLLKSEKFIWTFWPKPNAVTLLFKGDRISCFENKIGTKKVHSMRRVYASEYKKSFELFAHGDAPFIER